LFLQHAKGQKKKNHTGENTKEKKKSGEVFFVRPATEREMRLSVKRKRGGTNGKQRGKRGDEGTNYTSRPDRERGGLAIGI